MEQNRAIHRACETIANRMGRDLKNALLEPTGKDLTRQCSSAELKMIAAIMPTLGCTAMRSAKKNKRELAEYITGCIKTIVEDSSNQNGPASSFQLKSIQPHTKPSWENSTSQSHQNFAPHWSTESSSSAAGTQHLSPTFFPVESSMFGDEEPFENILLKQRNQFKQKRSRDEAKEEPSTWNDLQPISSFEEENLAQLSKLGFSKKKSLETLRECGGNLQLARSTLLNDLRDLQEADIMDKVALASEETAQRDKKRARESEQLILSYSDVLKAGIFKRSLFLDTNVGLDSMRDILTIERDDGVFDLSDQDLRDECLKLLKLEVDSIKWYGLSACSYMYSVILRLKEGFSLTSLEKEVKQLEKILFLMPEKAGDVPRSFLEAQNEHPFSKLKELSGSSIVALTNYVATSVGELDGVELMNESEVAKLKSSSSSSSSQQADIVDLT